MDSTLSVIRTQLHEVSKMYLSLITEKNWMWMVLHLHTI